MKEELIGILDKTEKMVIKFMLFQKIINILNAIEMETPIGWSAIRAKPVR